MRAGQFDVAIGEELRRLAGDAAAIAVAQRRPGEAGEQAALRDAVEIEHELEAPLAQSTQERAPCPREAANVAAPDRIDELAARKDERLVDAARRGDGTRRRGLDQPREMTRGMERAQGRHRRQRSQHVAQRSQPDHEDPLRSAAAERVFCSGA